MSESVERVRHTSIANQVAEVVVLAGATSLLAWLAKRVSSGESEKVDESAREVTQAARASWLDTAARPITLLSMPIVVVSATLALALWLKEQGKGRAALAVTVAPVLAAATGQAFTTFFPQRNPPDHTGSAEPEASFPSGHTTGVTAEALTISYVLWQEDLATPELIAGLMAWPVLVGLARVYRNRHWSSDVIGGWVAGAGIAALTTFLYDLPLSRPSETNEPTPA